MLLFDSLGLGLLHLLDQPDKGLGRMNGKISQNFPIELDVQLIQSMNETAVGKAVIFGSRLDTDDPKTSKIPLPGPSIPVRILERTLHSLFGCPVVMASCSPVAFGQF
jgi:hypothetical protein